MGFPSHSCGIPSTGGHQTPRRGATEIRVCRGDRFVGLVWCGTDDNTGGSSAASQGSAQAVDCGGDKALKASGSSARAMR